MAALNVELENPEGLGHGGVEMYVWLNDFFRFPFSFYGFLNSESELVISESHVLRRYKTGQENIDACFDCRGHCDHTVGAWLAVEAADEVGEVVQD